MALSELETHGHDGYPIMGQDTLANANKAKNGLAKAFPEISCRVISDPTDMLEVTSTPPTDGKVLIQVFIPEGKVDTVELMRVWSESLNEKP